MVFIMQENNIKKINNEIRSCEKCNLYKTKKNYVLGSGFLNWNLILVGEAPGYNEDLKGIPFVGKAGKILDELLYSINIDRKNVYITNILKCRPPKNRNPLSNEIKQCTKYLDEEINIIKPTVISPLGNFASKFILEKYDFNFEKISLTHGKILRNKLKYGNINIIPQYHPAVAVYNKNMIKTLEKDFKIIKNLLKNNHILF